MPTTRREPADRRTRLWEPSLSVEDTCDPTAPDVAVRGDVLIRTRRAGTRPRYTLSRVPGPEQIAFASMQAATRHARGFAAQAGVDVLEDLGRGRLLRLARFRAELGGPHRLEAEIHRPSSPPGENVAAHG